ncbi:hypothetical protein FOZ62_013004, partial [Perkinsus olseni]
TLPSAGNGCDVKVVKFRGNEDGRASSWSLRPVKGKSGLWSSSLGHLWAAGGDEPSAVLKLTLAAAIAGTSDRDEPLVTGQRRVFEEVKSVSQSMPCCGSAGSWVLLFYRHHDDQLISRLLSLSPSTAMSAAPQVNTTTAIDDSHASTTDCSPSESPRTSAKVEEDNMRLLVHVRDRSFVIRCGAGGQHIRWLANMGIARYCPVYSKRGSTIRSGTPSGLW